MAKHSVEAGPLLHRSHFDELAREVKGKRIYYLRPQTKNVGTELSVRGTLQFFEDNNVSVLNDWTRDELPVQAKADCLVYGGGIVGTIEKGSVTRQWLVSEYLTQTKLPVICLPMTHMGSDEPTPIGQHLLFARESRSLKYLPESRLAPDLAFYYKAQVPCHTTDGNVGIFLRSDPLSFVSKHWKKGYGDPINFVNNLDEYFDLASRFEHLQTDRLMFAVCGLLLGRKVTLLPDDSGKNRAIYENWLLGTSCSWSEPGVSLI